MQNCSEILLTKNKMDLNNRKMKNRPPCPAHTFFIKWSQAPKDFCLFLAFGDWFNSSKWKLRITNIEQWLLPLSITFISTLH